MASSFPPGTPYMAHAEPVCRPLNGDAPEVCPECGNETLYRFHTVVLHDEGAVDCGVTSACGTPECTDEG